MIVELSELLNAGGGIVGGVAGVVFFFLLIAFFKAIIRVTLPDQILVVTGRRRIRDGKRFGFSVERGRTTKIPYLQSVSTLDIGVVPINVRVEGVNSANGITVGADATACVCIDDDNEAMLYSAVERLMGKDRQQIHDQIRQTLIGNFRGALNKATPLQAIGMEESWKEEADEEAPAEERDQGERAQFRAELLTDINSDLSSFGMKVVSVSLQKIWDTSNYIANLAQKPWPRRGRRLRSRRRGCAPWPNRRNPTHSGVWKLPGVRPTRRFLPPERSWRFFGGRAPLRSSRADSRQTVPLRRR